MQLPPTPRIEFLRELVGEIAHNYGHGRVIVAIDGIDGAGKTSFGDDLAAVFREAGHDAFRASMEDFHRSRAERYRDGRESPESFYRDSFDYGTFRRVLIDPFRMAGSTGFQTAAWDVRRDAPTLSRWITGQPDGVLIVDGVFLSRPELRGIWNYSILLEVPWDVAYARLAERDARDPNPDAFANARYREGQELYFAEANPRQYASALVDNADPAHPKRIFADSC
ncbi:uridine kinase [Diaminobutyricibacter tongyongensis]|uniref:Uridine kinase n=1 Tax=Leifsonia tongyongensis TaxID=1268043 RepID=A0A6L9Y1P5_9MICO|nr:uridine kinase [Diaminobutyricibacter tongyongensis]NEN07435.1 uridine kinase [Diaminobutyricibacter tongyongensis]